jgi:catechol 2,3-dioxygenase-like lactoylglutathione lyase family enzyme
MMIPVLMVRDMPEAMAFLNEVLDFRLVFATPTEAPFYAVFHRGADEVHLNLAHADHGPGGASFIVVCDEVDALFASFVSRGLAVAKKKDSPVHAGPLNQTWGTREVYIDDPSGNTIIFQQR